LEVQMKKLLVLAAAALLAAVPAAAQQVESPAGDQPAVQQVATAQEDAQQQAATPSIFVSREQIQQRVAAMEAERNGESAQMNQSFWYLVAAIALGVLVALLLAD
jgi:Spy/CpxP family protein refolding chaperone